MALLKIIKLSNKTWKHNGNVDGDFILTKFYAKEEFNKFLIVETYGSKRREYLINEIEVYDIGGSAETFANFNTLFLRLEALSYPAFYIDGEFVFNPSSYDLSEFGNASLNPFVRVDEVLSNDIGTYSTATTPLVGIEQALVYQDGEWKEVAVSELGGGGGSSLRTESYEFVTGNQSLAASTLAHTPRYDVANSINNCLFITGLYDWATEAVTDSRMLGRNITFNQKAIRATINYALISTNTTFRVFYFKPSPSGSTNVAVDNLTIWEKTIVNAGGVRQPLVIEIPSDVTMAAGGIISFAIFNNNVVVVPKGITITVDTEEVI